MQGDLPDPCVPTGKRGYFKDVGAVRELPPHIRGIHTGAIRELPLRSLESLGKYSSELLFFTYIQHLCPRPSLQRLRQQLWPYNDIHFWETLVIDDTHPLL